MGANTSQEIKKQSPNVQIQQLKKKLEQCEWIQDQLGGICGEDVDYIQQKFMTNVPNRHIGVVLAVHPMGAFQLGTGILISRNLVLTCAHVIHCKIYQNKPYPEVYFFPAQYGELSDYFIVQDTATPDEYTSQQRWLFKKAYDYSLLKLAKSVEESDFLPLNGDLPQLDKTTTLSIFGYPESKYGKIGNQPKHVLQYGLTRKGYILDIYKEAGYMVHRISAQSGQSGSPVIKTQENGNMTIVGLHVGTTEEETKKYENQFPNLKKANLCKLTNRPMIERLTMLARNLEGQMFMVVSEEQNLAKTIQEKQKQWQRQKQERQRQWLKEKQALSMLIKKQQEEKQCQTQSTKHNKQKEQYSTIKVTGKSKDLIEEGDQYQRTGRYEKAVECYQKALQLQPKLAVAYNNMGSALNHLGKNQEATECLKKVLEINPNDPIAYTNIGYGFYLLGKNQEAVDSYKKSLEIDPQQVITHINMGIALSRLGKNQDSLISFQKALKIDPNRARTHLNMGHLLQHLGKFDESIKSYHRVIELDYRLSQAYGGLEQLLLNKCRDTIKLAQEVKFLEYIIAKYPDSQRAKSSIEILKTQLKEIKK